VWSSVGFRGQDLGFVKGSGLDQDFQVQAHVQVYDEVHVEVKD